MLKIVKLFVSIAGPIMIIIFSFYSQSFSDDVEELARTYSDLDMQKGFFLRNVRSPKDVNKGVLFATFEIDSVLAPTILNYKATKLYSKENLLRESYGMKLSNNLLFKRVDVQNDKMKYIIFVIDLDARKLFLCGFKEDKES